MPGRRDVFQARVSRDMVWCIDHRDLANVSPIVAGEQL
jgi:hypothetical protein